ncbi:Ribosomal RNA adenine methyltransferase KsgA/Erm [Trinorchestia longiramus]|nr:Ribosomal RNA adenine methyltransferase KsgA/Erm [Trinorchestia longiramus]
MNLTIINSAYSWHFKNYCHRYNASKYLCGRDLSTQGKGISSKLGSADNKKLLTKAPLQFSEEAKSLIAQCKDGFREGRPETRCTILDVSPATRVVSALLHDLNDEDVILEINPGPGFLTRQLLERTKNKLILFEFRDFFRDQLTSAFQSEIEEGRLVVSARNFHHFYAFYLHPKDYDEPLLRSLGMVRVQSQGDRRKVKVLGGITSRRFFSRLLLCTMLNISIIERCDPTYYLYTTDELLKKFFAPFPFDGFRENFKRLILSNFAFQVDKIGVEKCNNFYPLLKQTLQPSSQKIDYSIYHLIRIEPNWTFLNRLSRTERELFTYFLQQLSNRPNQNLLIDTLEMWLPGIGIPLIDAGFNVFTFTAQLNMEDILLAYQIFRSHPNFSDCTFAHTATSWFNSLTRMPHVDNVLC